MTMNRQKVRFRDALKRFQRCGQVGGVVFFFCCGFSTVIGNVVDRSV